GAHADVEGRACGLGEEVSDGGEEIWKGNAAEAAAEELHRRAAQHRGVEWDRPACRLADLNVSQARGRVISLRDSLERCFGGGSPEVVEHDVDAGFDLAAQRGDELFAGKLERDGCVGAEGFRLFERLGVTSAGDDTFCSATFCDLYGELAGHAGGAKDENALAADELRAIGQRAPGGHGRVAERGGCG